MLVAQTPQPSEQAAEPPAKLATPLQPPATGSITGHVFLGDSHLPARMATIMLLPVGHDEPGEVKPAGSTGQVQTGLDGAYLIPNVLPGAYYVIAEKLGYVVEAPVSYSDLDKYEQAPKEVKDAVAAAYSPVAVAFNRTTTSDIVLSKGAVISGSVRFDDGEPYSDAMVSLLRKDSSGKWIQFAPEEGFGYGSSTDDQGNFRLTGLPSGEYLLRTTLALQGSEVKGSGGDVAGGPDYRWDIYFGYGVRPRDGKIIKLKDGEQSNGNTIEIPLARLHSISGTVVSAETGATINHALVELHNADDDSTCTTTYITLPSGQFHFPYVAEGEYTLKVTSASDMRFSPRICSGCMLQPEEEKPIRTYADASQSLIVKGEMNGITITVKPQPPAAATAAAQ
jgi:hypothetical protein